MIFPKSRCVQGFAFFSLGRAIRLPIAGSSELLPLEEASRVLLEWVQGLYGSFRKL